MLRAKNINSYIIIICRDDDLPLIVAIDLQPMAPIEGVIQVQGDITNARTIEVVGINYIFVLLTPLGLYMKSRCCEAPKSKRINSFECVGVFVQ